MQSAKTYDDKHEHLRCRSCGRVLIEHFWSMVAAETVPTFRGINMRCGCGYFHREVLTLSREES